MTDHLSRSSRQRYHDLAARRMMEPHYAPGVWGARHGLVDKITWTTHCADPGWLENSAYGAKPEWNSGLLRRVFSKLLSRAAALRRSLGITSPPANSATPKVRGWSNAISSWRFAHSRRAARCCSRRTVSTR